MVSRCFSLCMFSMSLQLGRAFAICPAKGIAVTQEHSRVHSYIAVKYNFSMPRRKSGRYIQLLTGPHQYKIIELNYCTGKGWGPTG